LRFWDGKLDILLSLKLLALLNLDMIYYVTNVKLFFYTIVKGKATKKSEHSEEALLIIALNPL
jgi:hypothetical protein